MTTAPASFLNLLAAIPPTVVLNSQTLQHSMVSAQDVSDLQSQLFYQRVGQDTGFYRRLSSLETLLKGRKKEGLDDEKYLVGRTRNGLKPPLRMDAQIAAATVLANRALKEDDDAIPGDPHEFLWVLEEKGQGAWMALENGSINIATLVSPTGPFGSASWMQLLRDLAADARNGSDFKEPASSALGALRLVMKPSIVSPEIADKLDAAAEIYLSSLRPLTAARLFFLAALTEGENLFEAATDRILENGSARARERSALTEGAYAEWDRRMIRKANFLDHAVSGLEACSLPGRPQRKYAEEIVALRKAAVRIMPTNVEGRYSQEKITLLARAQESIAEFLEPAPGQDLDAPAVLLSARYYLASAVNWNNFGEWQRGMQPLSEAVNFLRFLGIIPQT